MTREQAKQNLVNLGIENPTDEQVSNYLNSVNGEVQKEKESSKKYKEDAEKLAGVQKELDDLKNANLTDAEKAANDLKAAQEKIAELERKDSIRQQRANAMDKFKVTNEQANQIVKDDGSFDYDALGKIITEKESAAARAMEQQIAKNSSNPGGGSSGSDGKEKTEAEKIAESIGKNLSASNETAKSVLDSYM